MTASRDYLNAVRDYYDRTNPLILEHVGRTYQVGLVTAGSRAAGADAYRAHNLYCAARAGVQPGSRVLDAGCGNGGPSAHIAASRDEVEIHAVTLSSVQARSARQHIADEGLSRRVRVYVADFHTLPFPDASFDHVLFLESSGYSDDPQALFQEAFRVLRPGGVLYVKDLFVNEWTSPQEQAAVREFDRVYCFRIKTRFSTARSIAAAGFMDLESRDLTAEISIDRFVNAQYDGPPRLSAFGKAHQFSEGIGRMPIYFAELKATKR